MLYFRLDDNGNVVQVLEDGHSSEHNIVSRHDFNSFEDATRVANSASEAMGKTYIATDSGAHCYPRFDVVEPPKVGDEVSYGFNGDYYPCGKITKISAGPLFRRIETDSGKVFYRRKLSGAWVMTGGTWSLVPGVRNDKNPSF